MNDQPSQGLNWPTILSALCAPFVRMAIRHTISFREFSEAIKDAYIKVAKQEIERAGMDPTVTKIGLMTGIYRDEVSRMLTKKKSAPQSKNMLARIITQWRTDKRFVDECGQPRILTFKGEDSQFWSLARAVSKNINPAAAVTEMERLAYVERVDAGIKLLRFMETYSADPTAGLLLLVRDIEALMEASQENLFDRPASANVHIHTSYDNIVYDEIPKIRKELMERSREFHKQIREYLSQYDRDINPTLPPGAPAKVIVGGYSLTPRLLKSDIE